MKLKIKNNITFIIKEICLYLLPIVLIAGTFHMAKVFIECISIDQRSNPNSISCDGISTIIGLQYGAVAILICLIYLISSIINKKTKKQIHNNFVSCVNSIKKENANYIATTFKAKKIKSK